MNFWNHLRTSFKSVPLSVGPSNWYIRVSLAHGLLVLSRQTYVLPRQTLVLPRKTLVLPRETLVLPRHTMALLTHTQLLLRKTLVLSRQTAVLPSDRHLKHDRQIVLSEGPRVLQVQTDPGRKSNTSSRKIPRKTTICNKSIYRSR